MSKLNAHFALPDNNAPSINPDLMPDNNAPGPVLKTQAPRAMIPFYRKFGWKPEQTGRYLVNPDRGFCIQVKP